MWGRSAPTPPPPEPPLLSDPVYNNVAAALVVLAYIKLIIAICDALVSGGMLKSSDSRKIVHVSCAALIK